MASGDLIQVSGLWKNVSASGEEYFQGKLGGSVRILIFKNRYKTEGNQPDFQLYFSPVERREGEGRDAGRSEGGDDFLGAPGDSDAPPARAVDRLAGKAASAPHRRTTPEPPYGSSSGDYDDLGDLADPFAE